VLSYTVVGESVVKAFKMREIRGPARRIDAGCRILENLSSVPYKYSIEGYGTRGGQKPR
jgi:hypothetical protein